jgi:transcriptional regulator with XRE-family HTH domain
VTVTGIPVEVEQVAKNFKELQESMSPERRARVEARVNETLKTLALDELREARKLTQAQLATLLKVDQGSVSKMERRTDVYISTLRSYIEAMGGALHIRAVFPDGEVQIHQFGDVSNEAQRDKMPKGKEELYIERREEGDYAVCRPGSERASAVLPTQAEAIERAKEIDPNAAIHVERVRDTSRGRRDKWRNP